MAFVLGPPFLLFPLPLLLQAFDLGVESAQASLDPLRLVLGSESFQSARPATLRLQDRTVRIDPLTLQAGGSELRVQGVYPLDEAGSVGVLHRFSYRGGIRQHDCETGSSCDHCLAHAYPPLLLLIA